MKSRIFKYLVLTFSFFFLLSCNKKEEVNKEETIIEGSTSILVDETLVPVIEDQIAVFESYYKAKINIVAKSELEVLNSLIKEEFDIIVLTRTLSEQEKKIFDKKKIIPRTTKIAIDALAFISNKSNNDTIVALEDVITFMQGTATGKIKGLVFDNPNSSTVRLLNSLAKVKSIPTKGVFSFKTNDEVIKFVAQNDGMIGVVGINWILQPVPEMQEFVDKVNVLWVKSLTGNEYFEPTQNDIAEGKYPLARDLYIINCQGNSGLGMGFSSFVAGDIGQRIILKSGLLPVRVPGRRFNIRKEINTK